MNKTLNVKVSLKYIAENLNLNDLGKLALFIQNKYYKKQNKKDSIEYILENIKDTLMHGENYELINSSNFIEYILYEYVDKNLKSKNNINETMKLKYNKILTLSNCLDKNNNLTNELIDCINDNTDNGLYNFYRIQSFIYDCYYDIRKNINFNNL